ncbi:1224_t:CDS:2, partial [Funneliformis geosporum]
SMEKKPIEAAKNDDNFFNYIQLKNPTAHISKNDKSNICNDAKFEAISDFVSKLLISRKDDIDHILESQPVYAIGIDFQKESTRPCIACWVDKPLGIQILECLETLFEDQYEAIYQVIDCKTGKMLSSTHLPLFKKHGYGYFLDSIEVCVSPIARTLNHNINSLFMSKGAVSPHQLNHNVELSAGLETTVGGQLNGELSTAPKLGVQLNGGIKYANNAKSMSNKWDVNYCGCGTTGDVWSHQYTAHELDKY